MNPGVLVQQPQADVTDSLRKELIWLSSAAIQREKLTDADFEGAVLACLVSHHRAGLISSLPPTMYRVIDSQSSLPAAGTPEGILAAGSGYNWFRSAIDRAAGLTSSDMEVRPHTKLAVGFFHFNHQWVAGDIDSYHRSCTESLSPFLRVLLHRPSWSATLEMSGSSLEFVSRWYPAALETIIRLTERGQLEFASSFYTPSLWVAFTARDMRRSIEHNRKVVEAHSLRPSRLFFAQEAFFGQGVEAFSEYFDVAVCHDEYLEYYYDLDLSSPLFRLGAIKVVPASNHIMNTLPLHIRAKTGSLRDVPEYYSDVLSSYAEMNRMNTFPCQRGSWGDLDWYWYHFGAVRHFATVYPPSDVERGASDSLWLSWNQELMTSYEAAGYRFCTVSDFVEQLSGYPAPGLPTLVESSWNPKKSKGVFCWMGGYANPWESDVAFLSYVARTRAAVIDAEECLESPPEGERGELEKDLEAAWQALLFAESSDSFGWEPSPSEVMFVVRAADDAKRIADNLSHGLPASVSKSLPGFGSGTYKALRKEQYFTSVELFGGRGSVDAHALSDSCQVVEATFCCATPPSGVRLKMQVAEPVYCPSGLENSLSKLEFSRLKPSVVYLPLANGLIQLAEGLFLVKDNALMHLAAAVSRVTVEFAVDGDVDGRFMHWRFYLLRGEAGFARAFANRLNRA